MDAENITPVYDVVPYDHNTFDYEQLLVICEMFYNQSVNSVYGEDKELCLVESQD